MSLAPLVLSFEIAAAATAVAAVVGIGIAALLANVRFAGGDMLEIAVTAPMILPPTVLGYYLLVAFGRRSAIGHAFEAVFGAPIVFTRTGAVLAATVGALPLVVKSVRAALEAVDPTLLSAARTLGATATRSFFTVQLPLAGRGVLAALMLAFARSLGDFGMTLMVGGDIPGETQTASLAIFDSVQERRDDAALVMVAALTAIAFGILYAVAKLSRRRDDR